MLSNSSPSRAANSLPICSSIFWIRRLAMLKSEDETIGYWQTKRNGTKRGIVEVIR